MAESSNSQTNDQTELTMCDVLEEEQELEDDANAVLGGSDDTNCSYDKGYVSRQALYACTTCSADQEPSGVCLACSYKCHDGHEIVELYTKRNFRCDCGNSKFPAKTCSLRPDKEPVNQFNKYNQNFKGLYCSCSRPYPDLEDDTPDEMIQCVVCEDWYHGRHIGSPVPDEYSEMICSKCMECHKFLYSYLNKFNYVNVSDVEVNEKCEKTSESVSLGAETPSVQCEVKTEHVKQEMTEEQVAVSQPKEDVSAVENMIKETGEIKSKEKATVKEEKDLNSAEAKSENKNNINPTDAVCLLNQLHIKADGIVSGPAFLPENWRKELCKCPSCMDMYCKHKCEYLLNLNDTIFVYEECGKLSKNESQYDKGLNALSQLDRVKQMEAIRAYTSMKGQLKEYLKDFADSKRTVCESDIKEFFDRIGKRQKLNNGVPHFCR